MQAIDLASDTFRMGYREIVVKLGMRKGGQVTVRLRGHCISYRGEKSVRPEPAGTISVQREKRFDKIFVRH